MVSKMATMVVLIVWCVMSRCWSLVRAKSCPPGFEPPHCVRILRNANNICVGATNCANLGARLAVEAACNVSTDSPTFVGFSDLLFERNTDKTGWLWANGKLVDPYIKWADGEPKGNGRDCVVKNQSWYYAFECAGSANALCEYVPQTYDVYQQVNFEYGGELRMNEPGSFSCMTEIKKIDLKSCVAKCHEDQFCMGFYFSGNMSMCLLSLFFMADLDRSYLENKSDMFFMTKNLIL